MDIKRLLELDEQVRIYIDLYINMHTYNRGQKDESV